MINQDTIPDIFQISAVINDSILTQDLDSSLINEDSLIITSSIKQTPYRFITERDVISKTPKIGTTSKVPEWITFLIFGAFILLAILNFLHRKNLLQVFRAIFSPKQTNHLIREGNPLRKQFMLILALIYFISIPLLFYSIINTYTLADLGILTDTNLYFAIVFILMIFFIYKVAFVQLTANLFQTQKTSFELLINIIVFNVAIGVVTLPFIVLFIYTQHIILLNISIAIYAVGIILRLFRQIQVGLSTSIFSILHLFLYLCTLEFVPMVIVSKMIINIYIQ